MRRCWSATCAVNPRPSPPACRCSAATASSRCCWPPRSARPRSAAASSTSSGRRASASLGSSRNSAIVRRPARYGPTATSTAGRRRTNRCSGCCAERSACRPMSTRPRRRGALTTSWRHGAGPVAAGCRSSAIAAGVDLPPTPEVERLDPDMRRSRLESATSDLLGRLLSMPCVIVINDVHFMDEATLGLLRRLAADCRDRPWLIILTRRPIVDSPVEPDRHVTTIELEPLAEARGDRAADRGDRRDAAARASPARAHRAGRRQPAVPDASGRGGGGRRRSRCAARLDRRHDRCADRPAARRRRRWLRAASVLGMTVDPTLLQAMLAGTDLEEETWTGLEEFITMNLDSRLHFVHHLVRLTAYEGLPYRRRTELHAARPRSSRRRLRAPRRPVRDAALAALSAR